MPHSSAAGWRALRCRADRGVDYSVVFSSHLFLFYFLPLSLLLYYAVPKSWRIGVLALTGYAFYGWWIPWFCVLMFISTAIDYAGGLLVGAPGASRRRPWR